MRSIDILLIPAGAAEACLCSTCTANCGIVGNEQDRQEYDAENEIRDGRGNKLGCCGRDWRQRAYPDITVRGKTKPNNDGYHAENFRGNDVTDRAVTPPGHEKSEARDKANDAVAQVPVPVDRSGQQIVDQVANAACEKANPGSKNCSKENGNYNTRTKRNVTCARKLQTIGDVTDTCIEGCSQRHE